MKHADKLDVPLLRSLRRSSVLREVVPHPHCFSEDSEAVARLTVTILHLPSL